MFVDVYTCDLRPWEKHVLQVKTPCILSAAQHSQRSSVKFVRYAQRHGTASCLQHASAEHWLAAQGAVCNNRTSMHGKKARWPVQVRAQHSAESTGC